MSNTAFSKNEATVKDELLPATSNEIAAELACSVSYARDIIRNLRRKGVAIENNEAGEYYLHDEAVEEAQPTTEVRRMDSETKGTITRKVRETLADMESDLKEQLEGTEPARASAEVTLSGGMDVVFHRTDDHFGQRITDQYSDVLYDSSIATDRVYEYFEEGIAKVNNRTQLGRTVDTAHLLMGGDIVTNESIYEGQAHEIDENLYQQIHRAAEVYIDNIRRLSDEYPRVQIVCQAGNHGELRASNSSAAANADDILYLMLDKVIRESDMQNVTLIQSDATYFVDFNIRDWSGHLRHGHDASLEHIGTSAGKQRWLSWLDDHEFDVAFRGHYHTFKEEPVNGVPVIMGGTIAEQSNFEESRAISGTPVCGVHGVTDESPLEWTERVRFD